MTEYNNDRSDAGETCQIQAGATQEHGQDRAAELKANQERAAEAKAQEDARMAEESGIINHDTTNEQARPDTAAAQAQERAEKADDREKTVTSKQLDRELAASMDASDPPSSIQP